MTADQTERWLQRVLTALADPLSARILCIVAEYEVCVCYLVEVLHIVQPVVSRQLGTLRTAGLVESRRDGKWVHYRLREPLNQSASTLLAEALRHLRRSRRTQADLARLVASTKRRTGQLAEAPEPKHMNRVTHG